MFEGERSEERKLLELREDVLGECARAERESFESLESGEFSVERNHVATER